MIYDSTNFEGSLHCVELNSGEEFTGTLEISTSELKLSLFGYNRKPMIDVEGPIFVHTEMNEIVSLFDSFGSDGGRYRSGSSLNVYSQNITSNYAVVGTDRWTPDDLVARVSFMVPKCQSLFDDREKLDAIKRVEIRNQSDLTIFEEVVGATTWACQFSFDATSDHTVLDDIVPVFTIDFHHKVTIKEYFEHVLLCVRFLSFCSGVFLTPSNIKISRYSNEEREAFHQKQVYVTDHNIRYCWSKELDTKAKGFAHAYPYVSARSVSETTEFVSCLKSWVDQKEEWLKCYQLMMASLRTQNEVSPTRLLNACKWLEEIPSAKQQQSFKTAHIEQMASRAAEVAAEFNYSEALQKRISGALRTIKDESHRDRFDRLVKFVRTSFGEGVLASNTQDALLKALYFRGRAAHGHFEPVDDIEFKSFCISIYAIEALCFLLLASSLPIPHHAMERAKLHSFVSNYNLASVS